MFFAFLTGITAGSFLNVCIYRIPQGESLIFPASHCTKCGRKIKIYHLLPIISFMVLRGRSSCCRSKISSRYPLIEFFTGTMFMILYLKYGMEILFFKWALFLCFIIVIGVIDFDTQEVYSGSIIFGILTGVFFLILQLIYFNLGTAGLVDYIYGAAAGLAAIVFIIITTRGMGTGDAEICMMCGIFFGLEKTVLMIFISFILGGAAGIILLGLRRESAKEYMAFAPFITLASIITMFFGNKILAWYLGMF